MLFEKRSWEPIQEGFVTMTFRRRKRQQVFVGRAYRSQAGRLEVTGLDIVTPDQISDGEAKSAGYPDAATLVAGLRGLAGDPVYRITFRYLDEPDPRTVLANDAALSEEGVREIERRLDRLDRVSSHGVWTRALPGADRATSRAQGP